MGNFDDFKPMPVSRMGGVVNYQGPTKVLNGCAVLAQNTRYTPDTAGTRYGTLTTMAVQNSEGINADVTGVDVLEVLGLVNPGYRAIAFDSVGDLFIEMPDGSGILVELTPPFPLPTAARMRTSTGDNNMLMAFENGKDSVSPPIMYRGQTKQVMPISQNPIGALWQTGVIYLAGDLFRTPDGRWWRCDVSATGSSGANPPQVPANYGYFSSTAPFNWIPATATDSVGGSQWEEWTPACVQYLPAPNIVGTGSVRSAGTGSIPAGLDVYVKVAYLSGNQQSPRSAAMVFTQTLAGDNVTFGTVAGGAIVGGLPMPRWIAEMLMPGVFTAASLLLNIYVASVPAGSAPPLDTAYASAGATFPQNPIRLPALTTFPQNAVSIGCPVPNGPVAGGYTGPGSTFMGQGGSRYMIVVRKDANASLAPVDPNSPILVNFVGEIQIAIVEIARDALGNVTATVGDTTGFAIGQSVIVQGCTGDGSFNGTFVLNGVQQTLDPQGVLKWNDPNNQVASNDQTGAVILPAGPLPTAFLPPGGAFDIQDIAAFTVASLQDGSPDNQNAGPFFYIPAAAPTKPFSTQIISMQGPLTLFRTIVNLQRFVGGNVICSLSDVSGITPGMTATVQNNGDTSFNGTFQITSVIPGSGYAGTVSWAQLDSTAAAGPGGGGLPLIIQQGTLGQVQAVVQDASGLAAGDDIQITGAPLSAFNGMFTIASVLGNVVTFPAAATGQALQFSGTKVQFLGPVSASFFTHADHFAGQCELRNPVDGGNNPGSAAYPQLAFGTGNSLMFNPQQLTGAIDPPVQPIQWAELDANGNIIAYTTPWSGAKTNYTMIVTAVLVFPKAGNYTIHIEHDDGIFWGMGNGATRVSGPQNCPAPNATLTAANGYPVMGANNVSGLNEDDYVVNISAPGFYPIEIDYAQWPTGQCLVVTCNGANIFGQYTAAPSSGLIGHLQLLQNLPTCSPAGPMNITAIQQDANGNVTATVDNLGGLAIGQTVQIQGATFGTYFAGNGWVLLTDVEENPDGLSGTICWLNPSFSTPPNAAFSLNPTGWTVTAKPDILINFDDSALKPAVDVTEQLSSTGIYAASDVYFVPSIRQVAYVDNNRYPAQFIFSNEDDPGAIVSASGDPNNEGSNILAVQGADSSRAIAVREIKDGPIIGLKEKGGYQINPSDTLPSQWNTVQRWKDYGPVCADLVALSSSFIAFWDIAKGPHVYTGGALEWIGKELSNDGTLKRVNTSALTQGWAEVDEEALELKFGIPLDGAMEPNYELVVNYEGGWGFPEVVNRYGKLIVPREARKWSINPWTARCAKSVRRILATQANGLVPIPPNDPRINTRQFLYGMPGSAIPAAQSTPLYKTVRKNGVVTFYWQ